MVDQPLRRRARRRLPGTPDVEGRSAMTFRIRGSRRALAAAAICIALAPGALRAQNHVRQNDAALCAAIEPLAREVLKDTGAPSASVAVVRDGKIACLAAWGDARVAPKTAASPSMRYSIGSVSKQFTGAAILMLVEEGKLSLDDPVAKFLPDLTQREGHQGPPTPFAHVGLPGLLAAGLRPAVHAAADDGARASSTGGRRSRSISRPARSTSTATRVTSPRG